MANIIITAVSTPGYSPSARDKAAIRDRIRKNLGNDSAYFPDADIDGYINQAFDECSEISRSEITSETTASVAGTYLYTKPTDVVLITDVTYDNAPLKKINLDEVLKMSEGEGGPAGQTGTPEYWVDYGVSQIWLYPAPSEVKNIVVYYAKYADELSAETSTSTFMKAADRVAEFYATSLLAERDDEKEKADRYYRRYVKQKARFHLMQKNRPIATRQSEYFTDNETYE